MRANLKDFLSKRLTTIEHTFYYRGLSGREPEAAEDVSAATIESNRPLVGSEVKSLLESVNALLEKANKEIETQAMSPGEIKARIEYYAQIRLLVDGAIDSILRVHPELSERGVSR